LKIPVL